MNKHPLSDLGFFRFPDLTQEIWRNIFLLAVVLILTILITVVAQRRIQQWSLKRRQREKVNRFSGKHHLTGPINEIFNELTKRSKAKDGFELISDAMLYETTVARMVSEAPEQDVVLLGKLRQALHLNVMNPELDFVSTRQLLEDLPVRVVVQVGEEKLDLYCPLLKVNEEFLLFDLPHHGEIPELLQQHPEALLIYWRESQGEKTFRIRLEAVETEEFPLFRAGHAFLDPGLAQRKAFRLTTDLPFQFKFLAQPHLVGRPKEGKPQVRPVTGEGKIVDLSHGGASLEVEQPLAPGGLAQVFFDLNNQPMRLMLEVLFQTRQSNGSYLVHGRFRGQTGEVGDKLQKILVREQVKRLREKELLHYKPGENPA